MKSFQVFFLVILSCTFLNINVFALQEEETDYQTSPHRLVKADDTTADARMELHEYYGNCHCKAIKFKVYAPLHIAAFECNCSICYAAGFVHLLVEKEAFTLLNGEDHLTTYRFNTMQAQHTFCKICGIKPFYQPRSHPNDYSVNLRCLDISDSLSVNISPFDGKNWETNIFQLPANLAGKK